MVEGEVSPCAAIFPHRAVRPARRDEEKYAATPSAGTPRNAPKTLWRKRTWAGEATWVCAKMGGMRAQKKRSKRPLCDGAERDRTDDLQSAILALSQLSYNPIIRHDDVKKWS